MTGEDSKELVALREALRNEQADYESWEFYHAPENGSRESERRERRERSYLQRVASERLHRLDRLRQLRTRIEVLEREKAIQDSKTSIADQIQKSIQDILSNPEVAPSGPLVSLDTLETILMRHPVYGYQAEPVSPEEGGTRIPGAVRFLNEAYSSDFAVRHGLLADLMVSFQRAAARHPVVKNDDCLHLLVLLVYRLGLPTYDKTGKPATFPDELSASLNLSARWARLSEVDATLCRYGWPALPIEHSLSPTVPQGAAIALAMTVPDTGAAIQPTPANTPKSKPRQDKLLQREIALVSVEDDALKSLWRGLNRKPTFDEFWDWLANLAKESHETIKRCAKDRIHWEGKDGKQHSTGKNRMRTRFTEARKRLQKQ